jgi:D-glycero-D-manno-heptose 1,7-bisphosphate phosphatase
MGIDALNAMDKRQRSAVFFDRDGVLNRASVRNGKPYPPRNVAKLDIFPDAPLALAHLKRLGIPLIVVTNQPDVARGSQSRSQVEAIHEALRACLPIDGFFTCYHDDADGCECRKPKPGLLLQAGKAHGLDLQRSFLVGDRWRDIDAGASAGCATIWIDYGYAERAPRSTPNAIVKSLREAVQWITEKLVERENAARETAK